MFQCLSWLILLATNTPVWAAENLDLSASTDLSNEGYFVLAWQANPARTNLTLEQSSNASFTNPIVRDLSGATAATITGLNDGVYYFRLSESGNIASNVVSVTVSHHSLIRAGVFFLLGLTLFSILIVSILLGNRRAGKQS